MDKIILWGQEIEKEFAAALEDQLDRLLELIRFLQKNGIPNEICEITLEKADLWEWLYSKDQVELNDIKRELSRRLEKARVRGEEEFNRLLEKIGKQFAVKGLLLSLQRENIYCISTIAQYYVGIRAYLAMEKKDEFCNDLQECFPNIVFAAGIGTTINTLNRRFEEIQKEIVEHLAHIDGYQTKFSEMFKANKSFQEMAKQFTADTGIDCSPQAGRDTVEALKESRINEETGQEETIVCELHTKFRTFNTDRQRQDRIYFFPGKQGILGGRVIVKYIGKHL